jgi:hypothetical protein
MILFLIELYELLNMAVQGIEETTKKYLVIVKQKCRSGNELEIKQKAGS